MIGTTIGHYTITERLAIGSLGEAWLAHDTSLNRSVAIKILSSSLAEEETTRKRFLQEARIRRMTRSVLSLSPARSSEASGFQSSE